jgi:hypothetical protein
MTKARAAAIIEEALLATAKDSPTRIRFAVTPRRFAYQIRHTDRAEFCDIAWQEVRRIKVIVEHRTSLFARRDVARCLFRCIGKNHRGFPQELEIVIRDTGTRHTLADIVLALEVLTDRRSEGRRR